MRAVVTEILQDWRLNEGRRKSQVILVLFRLASRTQHRPTRPSVVGRIYIGLYKVLTNWFMGVELPPEIEVGSHLRLFHPHAIVVHPDTRIGDRCTLRQCVTLGNVERAEGPSGAPTLGDGVELGAGAIVLGELHVGDGATVGAGAVVVDDVEPGAVVVGIPARPLRKKPPTETVARP